MPNPTAIIRRGDMLVADLGLRVGSEQCGVRPVVIVQNDVGNRASPTTIVVPLTSKHKKDLPTHVLIPAQGQLCEDSIALCEQITTVDKSRFRDFLGKLDDQSQEKLEHALRISIGLE